MTGTGPEQGGDTLRRRDFPATGALREPDAGRRGYRAVSYRSWAGRRGPRVRRTRDSIAARGIQVGARPERTRINTEQSSLEGNVDLTLQTREESGRTVVAVGGEIDVYTAPKLRDKISEVVVAGHRDLVVDLEKVEFLDSTGLGVLVGGLKKVRAEDGSLSLVCSQERLLKIFRITGLAKVFTIHASVDDALRD